MKLVEQSNKLVCDVQSSPLRYVLEDPEVMCITSNPSQNLYGKLNEYTTTYFL